jgi:hypothetical protein
MNELKLINKQGYVIVFFPSHPNSNKDGYILEHRLKVELKIKRLLKSEEVVHHIDSDKTNNNIENLMLFKSNNEHKAFENKVKQFGFTNPIKKQIRNRWENLN